MPRIIDRLQDQVDRLRSNALSPTTAQPGGGAGFWDAKGGFTGTPTDLRVLQAGAQAGVRSQPRPLVQPDPQRLKQAQNDLMLANSVNQIAAKSGAPNVRAAKDRGRAMDMKDSVYWPQQIAVRQELLRGEHGGPRSAEERAEIQGELQTLLGHARKGKQDAARAMLAQRQHGAAAPQAPRIISNSAADAADASIGNQADAAYDSAQLAYRREQDAQQQANWEANQQRLIENARNGGKSREFTPQDVDRFAPMPDGGYAGPDGFARPETDDEWNKRVETARKRWSQFYEGGRQPPPEGIAKKSKFFGEMPLADREAAFDDLVLTLRHNFFMSDDAIALALQEAGYSDEDFADD